MSDDWMWTCFCLITTRKWSLRQGNIFTSVCQEFCSQGGACSVGCLLRGIWSGGCLLWGGVCSQGCLLLGCGPWGYLLWGGCLVLGGLQAHTQRGNWGRSGPGPHPRGKLRGIRSRPTAKGEIEGDKVQAHSQGGNWGGSGSAPPNGYCCRRYASYWNAFLFTTCVHFQPFSCWQTWPVKRNIKHFIVMIVLSKFKTLFIR